MLYLTSELSNQIYNFLPKDESEKCQHKRHLISQMMFSALKRNKTNKSRSINNTFINRLHTTELTRHLSYIQSRDIIAKCSHLADKADDFVLTLHSKGGIAKIASDISNYQDFPLYALIAHLQRGDVSQNQFTSICLLYQAIDQFATAHKNRYSISISENMKKVSSSSISYIDTTFPPQKLHTYSIFNQEKAFFIQKFFNLEDDDDFEILKEKLSQKPDSEKYFHTVQLPLGPIYSWSPLYQRLIKVAETCHFLFFKPVEVGIDEFFGAKIYVMVIPSFSMIEERLKILFGKDAIKLRPLIGECSKETITHYKLRDERVFQVSMPEAPTPEKADGLPTGGSFCFSLHDAYHAMRDSFINRRHRLAIVQIVDRIFKNHTNEVAENIKWQLMDGELIFSHCQKFGRLFNAASVAWNKEYKEIFLKDMVQLAHFWDVEYTITADDLEAEERELYETILKKTTDEERELASIALFEYYKENAREDDQEAQFRLGCFYAYGRGTKISREDAIRHWEKSTPQGLHQIAAFYLEDKDFEKTFSYIYRAAKKDHSEALINLAIMYANGKGTSRDLNKAHEAIKKCISLGSEDALIDKRAQDVLNQIEVGILLNKLEQAQAIKDKAAKIGSGLG